MNLPREDVHCPACPNPDTAFRLEDVGMKVTHEEFSMNNNSVRIKMSRPAWEAVMLEHLRTQPDDEHRQLYDRCVTELIAAGMTAEEAAQGSLQATVDALNRSLAETMRRRW